MSPDSPNSSVRRLAQYRPFEKGGVGLQETLRDLVLAALALAGGEFNSLADCKNAFGAFWNLDVEIDELRSTVTGLSEAGDVLYENGKLALSEDVEKELERRATESEETERLAIQEWRDSTRQLRAGLTEEDLDCLTDDLHVWLQKIITRHGIEAAYLLYPEDEHARQLFDSIDGFGTSFLPSREGCPNEIRTEALQKFIKQPTESQRRFLAAQLNTVFYMTVLTLDPAARQLVQDTVQGHRIYLDTNFLYSVFGAAEAREVRSAHRLLELTNEMGYEVAVTPWTLKELRESIKRARREVEGQSQFVRPDLAHLMVRTSAEKGFQRAFWENYLKNRTNSKDYFDRLNQIEMMLGELQVNVVDEGCVAVEQQKETVQGYMGLLDGLLDIPRHESVLEHDARCRLLVERLRGEGHLTFANARIWFLTHDSKLPRFADLHLDSQEPDPEQPPFCVSPSSWIQVMRALTPRTEDYDQTVIDLLTSPYVGYRHAVDQQVVSEVVGRMDLYDDASPELALEVLQDDAMVTAISTSSREDSESELAATVERSYSQKARQLQEQAESNARLAAEEAEARRRAEAQAEEDASTAQGDISELREDLAETKRVHDAEAEQWKQKLLTLEEQQEQQTQAAQEETERLRSELDDRDEQDNRRRDKNRKVVGVSLAAIPAVSALVLAIAGVLEDSLTWICAGLILAFFGFFGFRVGWPKRWSDEFLHWAMLVAAVAAVVVAIVAIQNS